jgi:hypothetical protein
MKMLALQAISLCYWMAPQAGGSMSIKVDNMYFKDTEGKLYKILEIDDVVMMDK